jgi:hypothetical protein
MIGSMVSQIASTTSGSSARMMYLHRLSVCIALGMKPEATRRPVAINTYPRGP